MAVTSTRIENLYREAHEVQATCAWGLSAAISLVTSSLTPGMPLGIGLGISAASLGMATFRGYQAWELFEAKASLAGQAFWEEPPSYVDAQVRKANGGLFLGMGFEWTTKHTQRALDIGKMGASSLMPPKWALKLMNRPHDFFEVKGEPWIHGLETKESPITMPWGHAEGNWCFFGTTGAGKTRLYELLSYQIIKRNDVLIVFDPKYDKDLVSTLKIACKRAGRPQAFCEFNPAFPSRSVRIDPTKNFSKETEIPSRIADILGGDASDSFVAFCWRTVHAVTSGLIYVDERPNLKKLKLYIESGPEPLLEKVLKKCFKKWAPGGWEDHVQAYEERFSNKRNQPRLKTGTTRQQAMVQYFHEVLPEEAKDSAVSGLVSIAEHARDHYGKMIAGLLPLLSQLTASPLDDLLSPDYDDQEDTREIVDMEKIIRDKRVLYIATDSLADATVGSAIAAILLADLRSVAGYRYNHGDDKSNTKIHLLLDEACELVNQPLIAIMNKGRGAGFISYLATQNFSDYITRFGSEDAARMVVGNGNNRLALRVVDPKTAQYMTDNFGTTTVVRTSSGVSTAAESQEPGMELRGGTTSSVSEQEAERFPPDLFGKLPDLHFVCQISGGKLRKGRFPRIKHV